MTNELNSNADQVAAQSSNDLPNEPLPSNLAAGKLAREGATDQEIRTILKLSDADLEPFRPVLEYERANRRANLRKTQTKLALSGNEQLLKVLGEHELEQAKQFQEKRRESLPDLIKYPNYG